MRTKFIATIGQVSESYETMKALAEHGMHIARMNFSHCSHEEYRARKANLARIKEETGKEVKILQDLQGPRIRVGVLPPEGRTLVDGETIVLSADPEDAKKPGFIFVDTPTLPKDVKAGEPIYLANGEMELVAHTVEAHHIFAEVVRGGILYSRKGVNAPHTKLSNSGITEKDVADVQFALAEGVDYVAASFVQTAEDMKKLRGIVGKRARIIAKIETAVALKHLDEIIQASDAIMVARGDLGIELPIEQIPFIQKNLVRHAAWHNKGVIIATQMLISMVNHPHPTRAEVSDVANAVWDGADAVMLSDETASGQYPIEALQTLVKVAHQAEKFHYTRGNHL